MNKKVKFLFLSLAIVFIIGGIFRNEVEVVYRKASAICLECIGIG